MPRSIGRLVLLLLLFGLPLRAEGISGEGLAEPAALAADQAAASLDAGGALRVAGRELRLGFALIELERGWLIPRKTPAGRRLELIFVGEGRLEADPPDAVEAAQLELFTGERRLDTRFTAAIFAAPAGRLAAFEDGGQPGEPTTGQPTAEELEAARAIDASRPELAELEVLDAETQLLLAALGEPLAAEFFGAVFESEKYGVICLGHDLEAEDPLGIGQWVAFEWADAAEDRASSRASEESGDTAGGVYDAWIEGRDTSRPPPASITTFEPRHYGLRIELDPAAGKLRGVAAIDLAAMLPSRVVKLSLHGDLEVETVKNAAGDELEFRRHGETLRVFLPERIEAGGLAHLSIGYAGQFFESGKRRKSRGLRDNMAFYPHAGVVDEATYELELRWPRGWETLAAGELVAEGKDAAGLWQKRKIAVPTWGITFAVGKFRRASREVDGVRVEVALGRDLGASEADLREILDTAAGALRFYTGLFGPYPLAELTLATAPAEISQSLFGFVTLSDEMMQASGAEAVELGLEDRRTVIAHEVAHQWWGHLVGWKRWRDQWISEALANYAAVLWARELLPGLAPAAGPVASWQEDLKATLPDGRSVESVGPLVLSGRLDSSRTEDAYEAVVYRKGTLVLDTLCQLLHEARCREILGRLARDSRGRKLTTEDLLAELERLSGRDLDAFARLFVYGTGMPEIYYRQQVEKTPEGSWRVSVEAEVESSYHFRFGLRPAGKGGGIEVERQRVDELDLGALELVVPLRLTLAGPAGGSLVHEERFEIRGASARASFELAEEPLAVEIDPEQKIFARFWDRDADPKSSLYYRGFDRFAAGANAEAGRLLEAALEAKTPATPGDPVRTGQLLEQVDRAFDASIHLARTRLAFTENRVAEAASALAAARRVLPKVYAEVYAADLEYLAAVLAWRQGDAAAAFARLSRLIFEKGQIDDTEAWLYLALAAKATGHTEELETALAEVRSRGVDTALLTE